MSPRNSTAIRQALRLTALIMAHGVSAGVHAQSTNRPPATTGGPINAPTRLPTVVVKGQAEPAYNSGTLSSPKYTEPLRDIPQTITVIPRAVIEDQGATTLRDVLRNVSGISLQAGEGGGGLPGDNLSIRGFNARSDIFVDGVRDFGAYSRDPFNLEQIEVAKGPSSSTAGRGSTGGSINLVSKAPRLDAFYAGALGLGTDDYRRVTFDLNQPLVGGRQGDIKGAAVRLNAMWHEAGVPGRDVVEEGRWAVAPSIAFGLETPTRVTFSYLHMEQDNVPDYGLPWVPANTNAVLAAYSNQAPPVSFDNFYGLKNYDFEDIKSDAATAKVEHDFNESVGLRNLLRFGKTERSSAITAPRFVDANTNSTDINRQLQRRAIDNEILANQTDLNVDFETGPVGHALVAGFEFGRELQDNRNSAQTTNQPIANLFFPNPNAAPFGPMPSITGVPNEVTATTLAPYAFDTLKFGEQWQLSGGLRWDHVEADYTSGTNFSRTDEMLSWRAGVVFKPQPNGSIYFGCGTSFNPSIEAGNTGLSLAGNNVNLEPEETRSFELGTKWDFKRLSLSAAIFRTEKTNARTPGVNPGDPPLVLDGEQVVEGIEFGAAGSITVDWKVIGGYTYLRSEIEQSNTGSEIGAEFGNTPEHSLSLWTTYALPWDLEVGGGAQFVGDRFNNLSSNAAVRQAPDYWLFDAMAAWHVNKNLTLRLNVYNLADERYIDRVGGGHFVPGAGRSAVLTASARF
ncbi:MAG TPA: TonB-dependent siderophore receptor [Verrucomicrobiae bacterium]|nr:TonB-dependent siderophore receptor [Verrucomicrobiae bacterium]